jgi:hypothetical protein
MALTEWLSSLSARAKIIEKTQRCRQNRTFRLTFQRSPSVWRSVYNKHRVKRYTTLNKQNKTGNSN